MADNGDINIKATIDTAGVIFGAKEMSSAMQKASQDISASGKKAQSVFDDLKKTTPSLRYALYDISFASNRIAQGLGGAIVAAGAFAAKYETAFTAVERTTLSNIQLIESIRKQLEQLSREIPLTFSQISGIASLGAQLGIATGDLAGFSKTVSEFAAVTNVSTETAAMSFGALGELLNVQANQYQNLGSAIAQVGVNSVATESEILTVATAIGGVANSAGLSADYVIGLSGALASLRVPAEQSRGAITRVFQEISRSASGTGVDMQKFADVMGISRDEAQNLATTNVQEFFDKFIKGLSGIDAISLTTVLDDLSLADIRVTNVLTRLSRNTELLSKTLNDSSTAFADGTFLSAVYALKVDDLASKFKMLMNSVQGLGATIGKALEPVLNIVVDILRNVVNGLNNLAGTKAGQVFFVIASGVAALSAALLGLIAAAASSVGALMAVRFAIERLGWDAATGGIRGLIAALFGVKAAGEAAATGLKATKVALVSTGIGAAVVLLGTLVSAIMALTEASKDARAAFLNVVGDTAGFSEALAADTKAYQDAVAAGNTTLAQSFTAVEYAGTSLNEKYGETAKKVYDAAQIIGGDLPKAFDYATGAIDQNTRYLGANTEAWFKNKLIQSEAFQALASKNGVVDLFNKIGFNFNQAVQLAASGGQEAVDKYFKDLSRAALNAGKITVQDIAKADTILAQELAVGNKAIADSPSWGPMVWVFNLGRSILKELPWLADIINGIANLFGFDISNVTGDISQQFGGMAEQASIMELAFGDMGATGTESLDGIGDSAGGAAKQLRFLTDYADDLSTIWERAFDIRFSGQSTLDDISKSFSQMASTTDDARQSIKDLNADLDQLTADKSLQEYFLSVAEAYGDTIAAAEARAKIAKIDASIASKNKELAKTQDKVNKTLVGNSDAAIQNRSDIMGLVSSYQDHIKALAASGMKQDELRTAAAKLKEDFIAQAKQLGYNEAELGNYAVAFDDVRAAIDTVPRDLTVDFNGDPALTAIEEFVAKANQALGGVGGGVGGGLGDIGAGTDTGAGAGANKPTRPSLPGANLPTTPNWFEQWFNNSIGMINDFFTNTGGMFKDYFTNTLGMWSDFGKNISTAWQNILAGLGMVGDFGSRLFGSIGQDVETYFIAPIKEKLAPITSWFDENISKPISNNLTTAWNTAMGLMTIGWSMLTAGITVMWNEKVGKPLNDYFTGISDGWKNVSSNMTEDWTNFTTVISGLWMLTTTTISSYWNQYVVTPVSSAMKFIGQMWNGILTGIKNAWQSTTSYVSSLWQSYVVNPISSAIDYISNLWSNLASVIRGAFDGVSNAIRSSATFKVVEPILRSVGIYLADGGYVSGAGTSRSDSIPANLSNGEYVVNAAAVKQYGVGFFNQLNQMQTPRFAGGGAVNVAQQSSGMVVSLSPEDRALLRNVGGSGEVVLYANNEALARSVNAGNRQIVATGGRP